MVIIIGSNKGGAGKTTTAITIAIGLAKKGKEVCIIDAVKCQLGLPVDAN